MTPPLPLEIIVPGPYVRSDLARTVASLMAQTDRKFGVVLNDDPAGEGTNYLDAFEQQFATAGIAVRRAATPVEFSRLERWNWSCAQATAAWIKLLLPGEQLAAGFVERLKARISEQPEARIIRCDVELKTEWGAERISAPFAQSALEPEEVMNFFPARVDWAGRSAGFAHERTAWLAMGGYAPQLAGCAALNLNVLLALHFGLENLPEALVSTELTGGSFLNESRGGRVNLTLEMWLILRQVKNYCLAAKLPWTKKWLFPRALMAVRRRR